MKNVQANENPFEIEATELSGQVVSLLRLLRKDKKKSAKELSKMLGKSSASHVSQIENRKIELSYNHFIDLVKFLEEEPNECIRNVKNNNDRFIYVKGKSRHEAQGARHVKRDLMTDKDMSFYSLLSQRDHINILSTEFQLGLTLLKGDESTPHYHRGDEFVMPLTGTMGVSYLMPLSSGLPVDENGLAWKHITIGPNEDEQFAWFKAWRPHYARKISNEDVWFLHIWKDPRGEAAVYHLHEGSDVTNNFHAYTFDPIKNKDDKNINALLDGFGFRLKYNRVQAGMSIKDLAKSVGIHPTYLSRLENNEVNPPLKTVFALTLALDKPLNTLFSSVENPFIHGGKEDLIKIFSSPKNGRVEVKYFDENSLCSENVFQKVEEDTAFFILKGMAKIYIYNSAFVDDDGNDLEMNLEKMQKERGNELTEQFLEEWDTVYLKRGTSYILKNKYDVQLLKIGDRKEVRYE